RASSSSAFSNPRSAKTLPDDSSTSIGSSFFRFPLFIFVLRIFQSLANKFHNFGWRLAAFFGLLLKHVQHENKFAKTNGINRAIGTSHVAYANLDDACIAEPMKY